MLNAYVEGQTPALPPWAEEQTVSQRNQALVDADTEIQQGDFVTLEQLKKEAEAW